MKKLISLLTTLALTAMLLCGCGSDQAQTALQGSRCVGTGQSGRTSGKQGGTAEFSVLVPYGERGHFLLLRCRIMGKQPGRRWRSLH